MTRLVLAVLGLVWITACDPIVGAECATGTTRCGRRCVRLEDDPANCGACGVRCPAGSICVSGMCRADVDGNTGDVGDVGRPDGGDVGAGDVGSTDGGRFDGGDLDAGDAMSLEVGVLDAEGADAEPLDAPPFDSPFDAGPVDASTSDAGAFDSGTLDASALDVGPLDGGAMDAFSPDAPEDAWLPDAWRPDAGMPDAPRDVPPDAFCPSPLLFCSGVCIDPRTDPDNCGTCGRVCPSGVCVDSMCVAAVLGDVVVIGHDYERRRLGMQRLVGNAVFIGEGSPVRVATYTGSATTTSVAGINESIDLVAASVGRGWSRSELADLSATGVEMALRRTDVLLVYPQPGATDVELRALGVTWAPALNELVRRGGVIVLLDSPSTSNAGTHQLLAASGLFSALATRVVPTSELLTVEASSDPVARLVPILYRAEQNTVRFEMATPTPVVTAGTDPVVVHRVIVP